MAKLKHILLVDDDEISNFITSKMIEECDLAENIEVLLNGVQATNYLDSCPKEELPELIFLDINMPLMNGFEVLDYCEKKGYSGKMQFIILSTSLHKKDKDTSLNYQDVVAYIEKPLTLKKILESLPELSKL